jgi:benzoate/toluate 1,2-dioxygenase reductase subunit
VCGTCKCRVESGEYDARQLPRGRTDRGRSHGGVGARLPDAAEADLVTAIAGSSEACKTRGQRLSETTIAFSLDVADAVPFLPGQ